MTKAHWAQVKALFQAATERPESERVGFLSAAVGSDEDLRREVESLLRWDDPDASMKNLLPQRDGGTSGGSIISNDLPSEDTRAPMVSTIRTGMGPYQIIGLLGTGGMGEVFRARDSKLNREVALKLLPDAFAFDPDRLARFRREARALAALNHPHIGAIYGLEESDGRQALVLELVDGVTLAERIAGGPLPVRETLTLARQIAGALEAAHEKGIVHRDLKPANIKVTAAGVVKVLDFGLAKTAARERAAREVVLASLTVEGSTRVGAVVGTAAYMSPEQARGLDVDTRSDIWAFGCVLFEMLSGRKAFGADADSDSAEKVLARDPDWRALPTRTPAKVRGLLRRCLEKDPARRLQTIAEARQLIDQLLNGGSLTRRVAAVAAAVLATAAFMNVWSERSGPTSRSDWVQLTKMTDFATQPALSPDGRALAFIRGPGSRLTSAGQIYFKQLPDGEPVQLTHDDVRKMSPVFSPDGTRIGYTAEPWDTWVVPVAKGAPYRWLHNASGLTWHGRGEILFSEIETGRGMRVVTSAEARNESRVVYFPTPPASMAHRSYRSPDGHWVLLAEMDGPGAFLPCRLVRFDGSSTGRTVGPPAARCTYAAWSPDGRWMYFSADPGDGSHLWRQRFPDGAVEQLTSGPTEEEGLAVSADGRSLVTSVGVRQRAVWLHDAVGDRQISVEGIAWAPLMSADGQKVCYLAANAFDSGAGELRVTDVKSGRTERPLPGKMVTGFDLSHDDRIVAAVVERDGVEQVWLTSIDGSTTPRRIPMAGRFDGGRAEPRFGRAGDVIFRAGRARGVVRVNEDGSGSQQVNTGAVNLGRTSPDGRWISGMKGTGTNPPIWLFSLAGADPVLFLGGYGGRSLRWAADGSRVYLLKPLSERTYVLPVAKGSMLPAIPTGGFRSEAEIAAAPGVEIIPHGDVGPGPFPNVYVYSRETVSRNIYRIPLR
jgi:serine/threonine protein kinase/Tol biopolymer transport system component